MQSIYTNVNATQAANDGDLDEVQRLIANGASPSASDNLGRTALVRCLESRKRIARKAEIPPAYFHMLAVLTLL